MITIETMLTTSLTTMPDVICLKTICCVLSKSGPMLCRCPGHA